MSTEWIMGIVFSLVGLLLAAIGIFMWIRTRIFLSTAQEVKGTVIRMVYNYSSDGGGGYSPVYQFRTIEGQTIEAGDSMSSNPPMFHEGQVIDVLYDPRNPQKARIKKWMSLYFASALLAGMGLIFGGVGLVMLVFKIIDLFS